MSLDKMLDDIRELARVEIGRQVNEGTHKLHAKHKAAAYTIDRLRAELEGMRKKHAAQAQLIRDAECRAEEVDKANGELKAEIRSIQEARAQANAHFAQVLEAERAK